MTIFNYTKFLQSVQGDNGPLSFLFLVHNTDDSFVTPPSTPPVEEEEDFMSVTDTTDALVSEMNTQSLLEKMYERYVAFLLLIYFFSK